MDTYKQNLGAMLRTLRLSKNATQTTVAGLLGITRSAYSYYESGKIMPDMLSLRLLAEFFGIPPQDFFYPELYACPDNFNLKAHKKKPSKST